MTNDKITHCLYLFPFWFQAILLLKKFFSENGVFTLSNKNTYTLIHMYVMNDYLMGCSSLWTKYFWKKDECWIRFVAWAINKASFGNFFIPNSQLFESQWVFEGSVKSAVLTFLKQNQCWTRNFLHFQRLIVTRVIDPFGRKR